MDNISSEELLDMANENRLLLFLESDEKDCFYQVMLDEKQFKKVSDAIFTASRPDPNLRDGFEMGTVRLSEDKFLPEAFDGLDSINPPHD